MKIVSLNINGVATLDKQEWVRGIRKNNKIDILGLQETKANKMESWLARALWGGNGIDYVHAEAIGASGGIITIWDESCFRKEIPGRN